MLKNLFMKQAVILVTHFMNALVREKFSRLQPDLASESYDCFLIENRESDLDALNSLNYIPIYEALFPGSTNFRHQLFFKEYPQYDYYWFVEYDVEFTGKWNSLMDSYFNDKSDFISSHIARYGLSNRNWFWWRERNNVGFPLEKCVKGFNPICRYSNKALQYLDSFLKANHYAHSEVLITSALYNAGFKLENFGIEEDFYPNKNLDFYTLKTKEVSLRYRPLFSKEEIANKYEPCKLFHPVKDFNLFP